MSTLYWKCLSLSLIVRTCCQFFLSALVICSSQLLMFIASLFCKQYGPRSHESLWSGFILFATMKTSSLQCTDIYPADVKKQTTLSGQKIVTGKVLYSTDWICIYLIRVHIVFFKRKRNLIGCAHEFITPSRRDIDSVWLESWLVVWTELGYLATY